MFHNNQQIHYHYLKHNLQVYLILDNNKLLFLLLKDNMIMLYHKIYKLDSHLLILNHMLDNLHNSYNIFYLLDNNDLVLIHFYNMMLNSQIMGNINLILYILNFHILYLMVLYIRDKRCHNF